MVAGGGNLELEFFPPLDGQVHPNVMEGEVILLEASVVNGGIVGRIGRYEGSAAEEANNIIRLARRLLTFHQLSHPGTEHQNYILQAERLLPIAELERKKVVVAQRTEEVPKDSIRKAVCFSIGWIALAVICSLAYQATTLMNLND